MSPSRTRELRARMQRPRKRSGMSNSMHLPRRSSRLKPNILSACEFTRTMRPDASTPTIPPVIPHP
jgi:hypothetical protein